MIINRPKYLDSLRLSQRNHLIKIITGLRRSGKSFLLKTLFRQYLLDSGVPTDHILLIDMESYKNIPFRDPNYLLDWVEKKMIDQDTYYIIIDEVQEVHDFVPVLSTLSLIDNADVYVTGSNSRFLSSDVVTEFRGRGDEIHLYPLSFAEFLTAFEGTKQEALYQYMIYGGLPQILNQNDDGRKAVFLRNLYRTVFLRDIFERNNIEMKREFEAISKTVASSIGAPVSITKITNTFKSVGKIRISDKTIASYIDFMQDAFLIEKADRYDVKGRKYIAGQQKIYFQDLGLRNAILAFRQNEQTHLMENLIYNEMRRRGWMVDVGNVFNRDRNEEKQQYRTTLEIDFVCNRGNDRIYIQSAWSIPDEEKMEQEKRPLRQLQDSFPKLLILGDAVPTWCDNDGIRILSIYDFLLNE